MATFMRSLLLMLFAVLVQLYGSLSFAALPVGEISAWRSYEKKFVSGEVLIKFKDKSNARRVAGDLRARYKVETSHCAAQLDVHRVRLTDGLSVASAIKMLAADPGVMYVEPNFIAQVFRVPNDTYYSSQWSLQNIYAERAWDNAIGDTGVKVAVIDTGVQLDHPDLKASLIPGYNFVDNNNRPADDHGHGTHVAGIIGSTTNNNNGVAGINWKCSIMPVKVLDSSGAGSYEAIVRGIIYAVDNGARVINMSLGGYAYSSALEDAINYALKKNCVVVAAAGNEATRQISYPAGISGVLSVGSTDSADNRSYYSNYGNWLSVTAPGQSILSTFTGGEYRYLSGTSMAAPHVAGLSALLLSKRLDLKPADIKSIIERTADDLGTAGRDDFYGSGRINAARAIDYVNDVGELRIESVKPSTVLENSVAKFQISGNGFYQGLQAVVISSSKRIEGTDPIVVSPWLMTASFDFKGVSPGKCSIEVRDVAAGRSVTLGNAIEVIRDFSLAPSAWPTEDGNRNRSNKSEAAAVRGENKSFLITGGGESLASPVIDADGSTYIAASDGKLYAFDAGASLKWATDLGARASGAPSISAEGCIYIGCEDGTLHALDRSGKELWRKVIATYPPEFYPPQRIATSPGISPQGVILIGSDDWHLYAISSAGEKLWSYLTGGKIRSNPAISSDGTVYFGSGDWGLYALTPAGKSIWKNSVFGMEIDTAFYTYGAIQAAPVLGVNGRIYQASTDGYVYAVSSEGEMIWECSLREPIIETPALDDANRLYVATNAGTVAAIDDSGKVIWKIKLQQGRPGSPVITRDGILYVADDSGYIYALKTVDGSVVWKAKGDLSSFSRGFAINADGALYLPSSSGLMRIN